MSDKAGEDIRFPAEERNVRSRDRAMDIHPHTSFTDGQLVLIESIKEAYDDGLYEKGCIEHGNPVDEDIDHPTTFLQECGGEMVYTTPFVYQEKFENIKVITEDIPGVTTLTEADPVKLKEDFETINRIADERPSLKDLVDYTLNYSMVVPHGVELDYNPAIETAGNSIDETIDSYEDALIDFLKGAESANAGYNYVLLSSHYVNTPFEPRYVKKDGLFQDMEYSELGEVLENYRRKEIVGIESMASKLEDMTIPGISGELMDEDEVRDLEEFVYDQSSILDERVEGRQLAEAVDQTVESERPGVFVVGAHPTLIERNEEFMDYFRRSQRLTTYEEIRDDLDDRLDADVEKQDVNGFLGEDAEEHLYPAEALESFYRPMVEAAEGQENFVFEVNGKGVERQHPSVFWQMLDEKTFGSDSHRLGEQPSRNREFEALGTPGETVFMSDKWLSMLEEAESEIDETLQEEEFELETGDVDSRVAENIEL